MDTRSESLPPRAEALLSQSDWVRPLVRGMGVDESGTEDVLQSTWLAALTRPPHTKGEGASLRAWLARVARNFALKRIERDQRRSARERTSAKEERLPSASDVLEREEARAQVVRALLDVPEPFRTTLLLRFYENLEPRDIARLQRVPGSTVRNRLRRGLELLGERLERDLGATWRQRCALVLPMLRASPVTPGDASPSAYGPASGSASGSGGATKWIPRNGTTGGGLVVEKIGLAAAGLLATGALVLTWTWSGSDSEAKVSGDPALSTDLVATGESVSEAAPASKLSSELAPAEVGGSRERASRADATRSAGGAEVRSSLVGRLLGPDGRPLTPHATEKIAYKIALGQSVEFAQESAGPSAPSGVVFGGVVEEQPIRARKVVTEDVLDFQAGPTPHQSLEASALVETTELRVSDRISGVRELLLDTSIGFQDLQLQPRLVLSNAAGEAYEAATDAEGRFRFDGLRSGRWQLFAEAPGCQSKRMEIEMMSTEREKSLDVSLDAVIRLRVKLLTPDGKDLRETLQAGGQTTYAYSPVPFARRSRPNERIRNLSENDGRRYGSGRWESGPDSPDESQGGAAGTLEIHDRLPLYVGVSSCGFVLDSRLVRSGEEEVVFVIAPEKIRALAASLEFRVVSSDGGLPIPGVVATIEGVPEVVSDANGVFSASRVPPGRRLLVLEAPDHARREEWIDVRPGARNDLGTRSLGRPIEISGRVVEDGSGHPLRVSVELSAVDRLVLGARMPFEASVETDEDGSFSFSVAGQGLHLVSVENLADPIRVDTRDGMAKELVVRTSLPHTVRVMFPIEPPPDADYVVELSDGTPIQITPCEGWKPLELTLGEGTYRARLVDGPGAVWTRLIRVNSNGATVTDEPLEKER